MGTSAVVTCIQKMGTLLCEAIDAMKAAGFSNPLLNGAEEICQVLLPDLNSVSLSEGAQMAESAFNELKKIKSVIESKL